MGNINNITDLFNKEDGLKELLYNCTNEKQENQVRTKLKNIYTKLENVYIN